MANDIKSIYIEEITTDLLNVKEQDMNPIKNPNQ